MAKKSIKKSFGGDLDIEMETSEQTTKKSSGSGGVKSFAMDLEDMFRDALEEKLQEAKVTTDKNAETTPKKKRTKPSFGIDLLIRNTVEEGVKVESDTKRVTFAFDKTKIEKLEEIAKQEKARLRDIVDKLVEEYILHYEGKAV